MLFLSKCIFAKNKTENKKQLCAEQNRATLLSLMKLKDYWITEYEKELSGLKLTSFLKIKREKSPLLTCGNGWCIDIIYIYFILNRDAKKLDLLTPFSCLTISWRNYLLRIKQFLFCNVFFILYRIHYSCAFEMLN